MLPSYRIETSQLIFSANQQTGFYMMGTLVVKVLRKNSRNIPISWLSLNQARYIFHNKPGFWFLNFTSKSQFYFSPFVTQPFSLQESEVDSTINICAKFSIFLWRSFTLVSESLPCSHVEKSFCLTYQLILPMLNNLHSQ